MKRETTTSTMAIATMSTTRGLGVGMGMTRSTRCPGRRVKVALGLAGLVAALSGCDSGPTPGSRLTTARVLGARVSAGGDAQRTWPRPGETAVATWIVAGPKARPLAWSFAVVACTAAMDDDECLADGANVPAMSPGGGAGSSDGTTPPVLAVTAPPPSSPGAAGGAPVTDRMIVSGVICAGGTVRNPTAAAWSRCAAAPSDGQGAVDETDVRLTIRVQLDAIGNAPPSLGDDAIAWDGAPWSSGGGDPSLSAAGGTCADDASLPRVTLVEDHDHEVVVTTDAADREVIDAPPATGSAPSSRREGAQLSAFATLGSFQTQFRAVLAEDDQPTTPLRLKWTPPSKTDAALDAGGRLVRFVFVLRDGRGGLDATTRTVCLLPPAAP